MDPAQQFSSELFQLTRRWRIRLDERLKGVGLTKSAWAVLYWISRNPDGVRHRELAEQIGVEASTLSRQLDALQAHGLIERCVKGDDRRSKLVRLTPKAGPVLQRMAAIVAAARAEFLSDEDPAELERAVALFRRVRARLCADVADPAPLSVAPLPAAEWALGQDAL